MFSGFSVSSVFSFVSLLGAIELLLNINVNISVNRVKFDVKNN